MAGYGTDKDPTAKKIADGHPTSTSATPTAAVGKKIPTQAASSQGDSAATASTIEAPTKNKLSKLPSLYLTVLDAHNCNKVAHQREAEEKAWKKCTGQWAREARKDFLDKNYERITAEALGSSSISTTENPLCSWRWIALRPTDSA